MNGDRQQRAGEWFARAPLSITQTWHHQSDAIPAKVKPKLPRFSSSSDTGFQHSRSRRE
jgi:hypothetical protein